MLLRYKDWPQSVIQKIPFILSPFSFPFWICHDSEMLHCKAYEINFVFFHALFNVHSNCWTNSTKQLTHIVLFYIIHPLVTIKTVMLKLYINISIPIFSTFCVLVINNNVESTTFMLCVNNHLIKVPLPITLGSTWWY